MYPEFIAIYIGLTVLAGLAIAILILLIRLLKGNDTNHSNTKYINTNSNVNPTIKTNDNMAFCKKCATQFNASERFCPNCGTPR